METKRIKHQRHEFIMTVGKHEVKVICTNKREGKQKAAQAMLKKLHPNVGYVSYTQWNLAITPLKEEALCGHQGDEIIRVVLSLIIFLRLIGRYNEIKREAFERGLTVCILSTTHLVRFFNFTAIELNKNIRKRSRARKVSFSFRVRGLSTKYFSVSFIELLFFSTLCSFLNFREIILQ